MILETLVEILYLKYQVLGDYIINVREIIISKHGFYKCYTWQDFQIIIIINQEIFNALDLTIQHKNLFIYLCVFSASTQLKFTA